MSPLRPFLPLFCAVAIPFFVIQNANAAAELSLSQGAFSVLVIDNQVGDTNPVLGAITFSGSIGSFSGTFSAGTTKPFIGSAVLPQLSLTSTGITTGGEGGSLTILFGDTDFGPVNNGSVSAHVGGSTAMTSPALGSPAGEVSYLTFMDGSNQIFGLNNALTTQGPLGGLIFDSNVTSNVTFGLNTSLTQEVIVSQGANAVTGLNSTLRITSAPVEVVAPENGSTVVLLMAAFVGLLLMRRGLDPEIS